MPQNVGLNSISNSSIKLDNLYVIYNKNTNPFVAIKDFSFNFELGKIYCIIGESGSGKSSLISCFNGLTKPVYGSINIMGNLLDSKKRLNKVLISKTEISPEIETNKKRFIVECAKHTKKNDCECALKSFINKELKITRVKRSLLKLKKLALRGNYFLVTVDDDLKFLSNYKNIDNHNIDCLVNKKVRKKIKDYKNIRKKVGMVYQFPEFQLFKPSVIADTSFGAINLKMKKQEAYEKAKENLLKVNIDESLFNNSPFALSGGQKRRVALAGVFTIDPDIYIFDEPTAGLDPQGELEMIKYMLDAKKSNKTIFVVTHSMDQVLSIADEILVIHNGRLIKSGTSYEVFCDDSVLKNSNIRLPLVIKTIKNLIKADKKFEKLLEWQPKNIDDLAECILKIKRSK